MLNASVRTIRYIAGASLFAVFVIDIITPPAFVVDILYICCILLVYKQNSKTILSFSIAAISLIFIDGLFFNHRGTPILSEWVNRGISVFAILIISYIATLYGKLNQATRLKEKQYLEDLKEMLFITSHKVRKPVANIIGLIESLNDANTDFSAEDLKTRYVYLQFSANELDVFLKELNLFIERAEQHNHA
jgi:signal transduction histidine kinase